jgi:energy-coupling factor transporter ATP-binding protein EcfA2
VLDEPTAHLDTATAATVEENLRRELDGRTVIWIRHSHYHHPANRPRTTPAQAGTLADPSPDHLDARTDLVAVFETRSLVRD